MTIMMMVDSMVADSMVALISKDISSPVLVVDLKLYTRTKALFSFYICYSGLRIRI